MLTFSYIVRTQHEGDPAFIVPVRRDGVDAYDAACRRFASQIESSKATTRALLVMPEGENVEAYVFPVRKSYEVVR